MTHGPFNPFFSVVDIGLRFSPNSTDYSLYIFLKNYSGEIDKRSNISFGDHFINSHNLSS